MSIFECTIECIFECVCVCVCSNKGIIVNCIDHTHSTVLIKSMQCVCICLFVYVCISLMIDGWMDDEGNCTKSDCLRVCVIAGAGWRVALFRN